MIALLLANLVLRYREWRSRHELLIPQMKRLWKKEQKARVVSFPDRVHGDLPRRCQRETGRLMQARGQR